MFNDRYGLIQAVLDGRKTMTRRVAIKYPERDTKVLLFRDECSIFVGKKRVAKAPFKVGEIVAIAQSYSHIGIDPMAYCEVPMKNGGTRDGHFEELAGWSNKMFVKAELMPHHIEITHINADYLCNITNEECLREGIDEFDIEAITNDGVKKEGKVYTYQWGWNYATPCDAFAALIDDISGEGTWARNPIVWEIQFKLID